MKHKSVQSNPVKKKTEIIKPASKLKRFSVWVGQQNAFAVIFVFFLILFGLHKTYGVVSGVLAKELKAGNSNVLLKADKKKSTQEYGLDSAVSWDEVKTITTPTPSPSPIPSPTATPIPTPSPTPTPTPLPTTDPDPMIECTMTAQCGGNTVKMRRSECRNSVCCPVEPNKYESLPEAECVKRQSDYNIKQEEAYQKKLKDYDEAIKLYEESVKQYNDDVKRRNEEYEQQEAQRRLSYDSCVKSAQQKAMMTCSVNNTCDSRGYGSADWDAQRMITKCKQTYGF